MEWQTLDEVAPILAAVMIFCTGLWLLGFWRKAPMLKRLAVAAAILIFGGFRLSFAAHFFGWDRHDFVTSTPGPAKGQKTVVREFPFFVNYSSTAQRIELTPVAQYGASASGSVELVMSVHDPAGNLLAEERKLLGSNGGKKWNPLVKDFESNRSGQYKLRIEIPEPVGEVKVRASEYP